VAAAIATCKKETGIDILLGIGGAPEGVIASAAVRCVGGDMQAKLVYRSDEERKRAETMGIRDHNRILHLEDLAQGNVMFAATGVTDGSFLKGVHFFGGGATTHSVVMRSKSGTIRFIEAIHRFLLKPDYGWMTGVPGR
jgi:fructose-1,6-bisphosphatase II